MFVLVVRTDGRLFVKGRFVDTFRAGFSLWAQCKWLKRKWLKIHDFLSIYGAVFLSQLKKTKPNKTLLPKSRGHSSTFSATCSFLERDQFPPDDHNIISFIFLFNHSNIFLLTICVCGL